jgi:hypothetical protein
MDITKKMQLLVQQYEECISLLKQQAEEELEVCEQNAIKTQLEFQNNM